MPDAEYLSTSAKVFVEENVFVARGREIVFDGFTKILKSSSKEEDILPNLKEGDSLKRETIDSNKNLLSLLKIFKAPVRDRKKRLTDHQLMQTLFQLFKIEDM